jgi:hypothetical protein
VIPRPVDTRRVRAARAGGASAVATITAAAAHTVGGGSAPGPWLVLTVALLAWPVALVVVGARHSPARTALAVGGSQLLLHAAFAIVGDAAPVVGRAAAHHHAVLPLATSTAATMPLDAVMLAGHTLAAILTAVAVCHGERMLRAVARGIRQLLRSPITVTPLAVGAAPVAAEAPRGLRPRLVLSDLSRRGPPR